MTDAATDPDQRLARIDQLLGPMRRTLGADGYLLNVASTTDGGVRLTIEATPGVCADCLVPRSVFVALSVDALTKGGIDIAPSLVDVNYPEH